MTALRDVVSTERTRLCLAGHSRLAPVDSSLVSTEYTIQKNNIKSGSDGYTATHSHYLGPRTQLHTGHAL